MCHQIWSFWGLLFTDNIGTADRQDLKSVLYLLVLAFQSDRNTQSPCVNIETCLRKWFYSDWQVSFLIFFNCCAASGRQVNNTSRGCITLITDLYILDLGWIFWVRPSLINQDIFKANSTKKRLSLIVIPNKMTSKMFRVECTYFCIYVRKSEV